MKQGADVTNEDGKLVKIIQSPASKPSKVMPFAVILDLMKDLSKYSGVTALYHESTFLEQHAHLLPTGHSTTKQAAEIAKLAKVGQLILGHYSTRYDDLLQFKTEASEVFENIILASDGKTITI